MRLVIITHVVHIYKEKEYFGYAPYVREMNVWLKYTDELIIVAPLTKNIPGEIDMPYSFKNIDFKQIPNFNFTTLKNVLDSIFKLPLIFWRIFWAMKKSDHIHLRCPGNVGLIGCLVQILFPHKKKTAKYAGNWDPASKQPWTYKLQKWILSNTFLTRNMKVLVYGNWENQSKNIIPFFTATYYESEKEVVQKRDFSSIIEFVFVGSLVSGKNPMYAIKLTENLLKRGNNVLLNIYGEGPQREFLTNYIEENNLVKNIILKGNQNQTTIKKACQKSHFVILPSKSEGWPKAVAEGMFWGCVPISTKVSCVPFMLDNGKRGVILEMDLEKDLFQIENMISNEADFFIKSRLASKWSQDYTIEVFEAQIKKLLVK